LNPFSEKLCQWFAWLVYVLIYNLIPCLTIKHFFVPLALIILGKENVSMSNINIYLQPRMDELMRLWRLGIPTLDYGKQLKIVMGLSFVHWSYGPLMTSHDMDFCLGVHTKDM
jgi:hypothetical protein